MPVNKYIIKQFKRQQHRGTEGFGLYDKDFDNIVRSTKKHRIMKWLRKHPSSEILFHHRFPTSTDNVKNACHPFSTGKYFDTNYVLVHNGVISNAYELAQKHYNMGINYHSIQDDGSFNDSEALLWDVALYLEGKQDQLTATGSIAFICFARDPDGNNEKLLFARNTNPLKVHFRQNQSLFISSEGKGVQIPSDMLHEYDYKTGKITTKELNIPRYTTYVAPKTDTTAIFDSNTYWGYDPNRFDTDSELEAKYGYSAVQQAMRLSDGMTDDELEELELDFDYETEAKTLQQQVRKLIVKEVDVSRTYGVYMTEHKGDFIKASSALDQNIELLETDLLEQKLMYDHVNDVDMYNCQVLYMALNDMLNSPKWTEHNHIDFEYVDKDSLGQLTLGEIISAKVAERVAKNAKA